MSLQSRYICCCKANACASTPQGFRLLSKSGLESHRKMEAQLLTSNLHLRDHIRQFLQSADLEYTNVSQMPPGESLVFLPDLAPANDLNPRSLLDLLNPIEPSNQAYLSSDAWYSQILGRIPQVPESEPVLKNQVQSFADRVSGDHQRLLTLALVQLDNVQKCSSASSGPALECQELALASIEAEIAFRVRQYHLPERLMFTSAEGCQSSPGVGELNEAHPYNRTTVEQLRWIDAVCRELSSGLHVNLAPLRKTDLLQGLEEHKENLLTHIGWVGAMQHGHNDSRILPIFRSAFNLRYKSTSYVPSRFIQALTPIHPSGSFNRYAASFPQIRLLPP